MMGLAAAIYAAGWASQKNNKFSLEVVSVICYQKLQKWKAAPDEAQSVSVIARGS
jgi:hypothetical protein